MEKGERNGARVIFFRSTGEFWNKFPSEGLKEKCFGGHFYGHFREMDRDFGGLMGAQQGCCLEEARIKG